MANYELYQLVSALCLFLAIVGALLIIVVPKTDEKRKGLGAACFSCGMGGLALFFVMQNPDVLASAQENIALTLIGMVIAFFSIMRVIKR